MDSLHRFLPSPRFMLLITILISASIHQRVSSVPVLSSDSSDEQDHHASITIRRDTSPEVERLAIDSDDGEWMTATDLDRDQPNVAGFGRKKREVTRLRYKDCGKPNRAIRFEQLSVKPIPIQIPGLLDLRIKANITRKLPNSVDVKLVLKKKYFGSTWMRMPCFKDYGSCRYKKLSVCTLTQDVFGCPIKPGFHNIDQKFMIPDPDNALYSQMLEGEYKAIVRARHPNSRKELACLVAHFSLKNKAITSVPVYSDEDSDLWNV